MHLAMADLPFTKLTPEQSRRLASTPGLKVEGFLLSPENREYFAARGVDLDRVHLSGNAGGRPADAAPESFRRPRYLPLQGHGYIRILVIEPGIEDEPLRCRLQHLRLQSAHSYDSEFASYDALSYTWNAPIRTRHYSSGPANPKEEFSAFSWAASALSGIAYTVSDGRPKAKFEEHADQVDEAEIMRPQEILVDGAVCDVTGNLVRALRRLRLTESPRNLWVDAICIDQQNMEERGEQVSQMNRIYQSADTVHIWLGPAADDSDKAMALTEAMWQWKNTVESDPMDLLKHRDPNHQATLLVGVEALSILLNRPWFTRRWVVQELAFARDAVVHCGTRTLAWHKLAYAVSFMKERRLELTYMRIRDLYMRADLQTYRRGYLGTLAAETMTTVSDIAVRRLPSPSTHPVFDGRADLEQLLSSLHTLQCTNPLDTVYALLALASDASALNLKPDYNRSVEEVCVDVVLRVTELKGSLNIFCQQWAGAPDLEAQLPSWIQSYRPSATRHEGGTDVTQQREVFAGDGRTCRFRASGKRDMQGPRARMADFEGLGRLMTVTGIVVDVIESVGAGAYQDIPTSWRELALGFEASASQENEAKVRRSLNAHRPLLRRKQGERLTPAARWATFADLVTANSTGAHNYSSEIYGPICEALFAAESPYHTDKDKDTINIVQVRADPAPAPLYSPRNGKQLDRAPVHMFLDRMAACTRNRAVARTCSGSLALVESLRKRAEEGDLVCVLFGCDVPVLLRPRYTLDSKTIRAHGVFEFIDEAYVQGIMHGEAVARVRELMKAGDQRISGVVLV